MGTLSVAMVAGERFSQLRTTSVISTGVNISTPSGQILQKSFEKILRRFQGDLTTKTALLHPDGTRLAVAADGARSASRRG
jgi:hypothetical protein